MPGTAVPVGRLNRWMAAAPTVATGRPGCNRAASCHRTYPYHLHRLPCLPACQAQRHAGGTEYRLPGYGRQQITRLQPRTLPGPARHQFFHPAGTFEHDAKPPALVTVQPGRPQRVHPLLLLGNTVIQGEPRITQPEIDRGQLHTLGRGHAAGTLLRQGSLELALRR